MLTALVKTIKSNFAKSHNPVKTMFQNANAEFRDYYFEHPYDYEAIIENHINNSDHTDSLSVWGSGLHDMMLSNVDSSLLKHPVTIRGLRVHNVELKDSDLSNITFKNCVFDSVSFEDTCNPPDFQECSLKNITVPRSWLDNPHLHATLSSARDVQLLDQTSQSGQTISYQLVPFPGSISDPFAYSPTHNTPSEPCDVNLPPNIRITMQSSDIHELTASYSEHGQHKDYIYRDGEPAWATQLLLRDDADYAVSVGDDTRTIKGHDLADCIQMYTHPEYFKAHGNADYLRQQIINYSNAVCNITSAEPIPIDTGNTPSPDDLSFA